MVKYWISGASLASTASTHVVQVAAPDVHGPCQYLLADRSGLARDHLIDRQILGGVEPFALGDHVGKAGPGEACRRPVEVLGGRGLRRLGSG
jgi:hypothetical protein